MNRPIVFPCNEREAAFMFGDPGHFLAPCIIMPQRDCPALRGDERIDEMEVGSSRFEMLHPAAWRIGQAEFCLVARNEGVRYEVSVRSNRRIHVQMMNWPARRAMGGDRHQFRELVRKVRARQMSGWQDSHGLTALPGKQMPRQGGASRSSGCAGNQCQEPRRCRRIPTTETRSR